MNGWILTQRFFEVVGMCAFGAGVLVAVLMVGSVFKDLWDTVGPGDYHEPGEIPARNPKGVYFDEVG